MDGERYPTFVFSKPHYLCHKTVVTITKFIPLWYEVYNIYTGRAWCWRHPWTSLWNENFQKHNTTFVSTELQEKQRTTEAMYLSVVIILYLFQLCNCSVWASVFIQRGTTWFYHCVSPPPRQEHYGLSAMALGDAVFYEHQHSQGHEEQPFHLCSPGRRPAIFNHSLVKFYMTSE